MNYQLYGELPHGASYDVRINGPVPAATLRKIIAMLEMAASWLEEDEKHPPEGKAALAAEAKT